MSKERRSPEYVRRYTKFCFVVQYLGLEGWEKFTATQDQYENFKDDPLGLVAIHLGVSVEDYLLWIEANGYGRCIATTSKKVQCRGSVPGRYYFCSEWVEARKIGEYCAIHGGEK